MELLEDYLNIYAIFFLIVFNVLLPRDAL